MPRRGENCTGKILAEWLEDGRKMKLLADYTYTDPAAASWLAPSGAEIDGASIPRFLWSFIGGPFEGKYRKASVVHDVACDEKRHDWRDVHRMFHNAMLCSGVEPLKAKVMYGAVYACGPRWGPDQGTRLFPCGSSSDMDQQVRRLAAYLRANPVSLARVETLQPGDLTRVELVESVLDLREPASDDTDFVVAPSRKTRETPPRG
jgi:Protein of unknown function (DUF1353)